MKKVLFVFIVSLIVSVSFAQRNNIDPKIQAQRDMTAIERKTTKENTDEEGVKLIKEHQAAKGKMDATMRKMPGYGKAATDKQSLAKFREKNAKKDPSFGKLSAEETKTRKAKENYLSNSNEKYKELMQIRGN